MSVFEELAQAIDEVDSPVGNAALAEIIALQDRLAAKVCEAVGEFDHQCWWAPDGTASMTAWLKTHAGMTGRRARPLVGAAGRLRQAPVTTAAWRDGSLSSGQVEVIVDNVAPRHAHLWAEHEVEVVPSLVGLSVHDTQIAMVHWAAKAEALNPKPPRDEKERELSVAKILHGRHVISGHLDAEGG